MALASREIPPIPLRSPICAYCWQDSPWLLGLTTGLAADASGGLYLADSSNNRLRHIAFTG
jgi:hypothetical protein